MNDQSMFTFTRNDFDRFILAVGAYLAAADGGPNSVELKKIKERWDSAFELPEAASIYNGQLHNPRSLAQIFQSAALNLTSNEAACLGIFSALCEVAAVDGPINEAERRALEELADLLEIKALFRDHVLGKYGIKSSTGSPGQYLRRDQERASHLVNLGLLSNATVEEIEEEYKRLVKRYHPDRLESQPLSAAEKQSAATKLVQINLSYQWLTANQN